MRLVVAKERQDSQCVEWRHVDVDESTEFNTSNRFIEMCGLDLKKIGTKEFIQRIEEYVQNYGQVKNVTTFAAFVDCGLEVDGFIPAKYINTINICVGDRVEVKSQLGLCEYSYSELQAELVA
uniref:S1 motif domain-containing protein n=1 Tax=Timema bartmani TaxID=61472 RepID=A0A7R9EV04_9NEOP|nr:unnamed protein product [Timema bartmani]